MANFYLPERFEKPIGNCNRYDNNGKVNSEIAKAFKESIAVFDEECYKETIPIVVREEISLAIYFKDVPYGGKTLGESGCAVLCFRQGLISRNVRTWMDMSTFAKYIADKGYYEMNVGTYHNLFDHYGLRRATHFQEIFDALKMGKLVTILVENKKYFWDEANKDSHFVNIVGKEGKKFVIDDSQMGRVYSPMRHIFDATRVAWIW